MTTKPLPQPSAVETEDQTRLIDLLLIGSGLIILSIAAYLGFILFNQPQETAVATTIDPTHFPAQKQLQREMEQPLTLDKNAITWTLTPKAAYQITARVLSKKNYHDQQAPLAPIDLALGWGDMSDPEVDKWIRWSQSGRWYHYRWDGDSPYKRSEISGYSANVHIIPATDNLAHALERVRKNDVILLEGRLVNIDAIVEDATINLKTSLTRQDTGSGACEILYVERLIVDGSEYQ